MLLGELAFATHGAEQFRGALNAEELSRLEATVAVDDDRPGTRIFDLEGVADLTGPGGAIGRIVERLHGTGSRIVRALMFDKRSDLNWSLGMHQDRTIAVRERRDVAGYGPWSIKAGQLHVQPPQDIIARMLTLRIHFDDVDDDNAPLLILPGTHDRGRLHESEIEALSVAGPLFACHARRGDVWAYGTAIVHGSAAVRGTGRRRRVLQVDYSRAALPGGLQWAFAG